MNMLLFSLIAAFAASPVAAAMPALFVNGISIVVHPADEVLERYTWRGGEGRLFLEVPGGLPAELVESVDDPAIANGGDGLFHPMSETAVLDAVRDVDLRGLAVPLDVEIFILPLPRRAMPFSSANGSRIYLSPGVREVSRCLIAYTVTHELGHVYQTAFLPDDDAGGWERYLDMRGILGNFQFSAFSTHAYRPREIFAEDFRYLFGGEEACYTGGIENPDLVLPDEIEGLESFIVSLAASVTGGATPTATVASATAWPNPFNPSTTIRLDLPDDGPRRVEATVHRVDGSLVSRLYSGTATGPSVEMHWDGRDESGVPARSGVYFYRIATPGARLSGKLVLIR
ncbi:MAG: hypothetical protein JW876_03180 [Candidatus Krumholzibacteriota bacterium]|nr:hypothetical protein [Candidatus Krumholzibacteriota bacterium]